MLANGIRGPISRADAVTVAEFLVATDRAVPPGKWCDFLIDQADEASLEGLF